MARLYLHFSGVVAGNEVHALVIRDMCKFSLHPYVAVTKCMHSYAMCKFSLHPYVYVLL